MQNLNHITATAIAGRCTVQSAQEVSTNTVAACPICRITLRPRCDIAASGMQADRTLTLLALPEDLLWTILRAILESVDRLHSPLSAARYLAVLAQTSQQLRAVTYRFLPVGDPTNNQGCADLTLH